MWNSQRRIQGRTDNPLNGEGRRQATSAAAALAAYPRAPLLTSPLSRARQTAEIIASEKKWGAPAVDAELIERDYGQAEGVTVAEAGSRWPHGDYPAAETTAELAWRAASTIRRVIFTQPGSVAVSHGAFIRFGVGALCDSEVPRILNGEIVVVRCSASGWSWNYL